jgi:hypothetical protein
MILNYLIGQWRTLLVSAALLVLVLGYALFQKDRADDAEALAGSRAETIQFQTSVITDYAASIEAQNEAIKGLSARREEGRVIYLQDYARADERAKSFDIRASELLAKQETFTDELAECRATKALLEQELQP